MDWNEIRVITREPCADAVAGLFNLLGATGVAIDDPAGVRAMAARHDWDAWGFSPEYLDSRDVVVTAYFPREADFSAREEERLLTAAGSGGRLERRVVRDEDWANSWKEYYHTERITSRLVVKPSWEDYTPGQGELVIEMDPGMAFGTGTHTTTRQCLCFLEETIKTGDAVLDVGTGSGILALAAALLGAGRVMALDSDPVAVAAARENVARNRQNSKVQVILADAREYSDPGYDVATANLTGDVIAECLGSIKKSIKTNGLFIGAGISRLQSPAIGKRLSQMGFSVLELDQREDWTAVLARRVD